MPTLEQRLIGRVEELIALANIIRPGNVSSQHRFAELLNGAITVMSTAYGANSPQVAQLANFDDTDLDHVDDRQHMASLKAELVSGRLTALKSDLDSGLVQDMRRTFTGEVIADFVVLARKALDEPGDAAKNVAAVLSAAVYEDTIRRMGEQFLGITSRDKLSDILKQLKGTDVMQGSQVGIAQAYLNFRNNSLHADWEKIDRPEVKSVLAFVEELLNKHFT